MKLIYQNPNVDLTALQMYNAVLADSVGVNASNEDFIEGTIIDE